MRIRLLLASLFLLVLCISTAYADGNNYYLNTTYYQTDITTGQYYYIKNSGSGLYANIHGPSTSQGAYIHGWTYHPNLAENWYVEKDNNGYYSFKSAYSSKYIGVDSSNIGVSKNNIKQYTNKNDYTKWVLYTNGSGNFIISPKLWSTQNLVSKSYSSYDDEFQLANSLTTYSTWKLYMQEEVTSGTYFVQNAYTRKYMDLYGPDTSNGTIFHQWDLNANNLSSISNWRKFQISRGSDLYYTIKNAYSNKYVSLDSNDNSVKQISSANDNAKFKFYKNENGEYYIVPKGYSYEPYTYSLSVSTSSNTNGTPLTLASVNSQRPSWILHDATKTYIDRIYTWGYKETTYPYFFGFFNYETTNPKQRTIDYCVINYSSYDGTFTQLFENAISHCNNQWSSALSPYLSQFNRITSSSNSDIVIKAGTRNELDAPDSDYAGNCGCVEYENVGFVIYQNEIYDVRKYDKMLIKFVNCSYNLTQFNASLTMTHEMGHALGYAGHSYDNVYAVMNNSDSTIILQSNEIQALKQIYDLFYN